MKSFKFDNYFNTKIIRNQITQLNAPVNVIQYILSTKITLMNRYHRQYFQSFDNRFRLTLDSNLEFFLPPDEINIKPPRSYFRNLSIIEIKYDEKHDDRVESISSFFHLE